MDMEARRQSVVNLGRHIEQREARLAELREDVRRLDDRIEKRADELVKMLSETQDSNESKTRVSQIKMRAIDGLRNWIQTYQRRRAKLLESLKRDGEHLPKDELAQTIDAFDQRIEKRVAQILELTVSMGGHEDVEKYESDGGSYWGGYYYESTRISDDWKQNRRATVMTDKNRSELTKALEGAIQRLESRRAGIQNILNTRQLSATEREIHLEELGRVDASLEQRKKDLTELAQPKAGGTGEEVGRNKAHDMEKLLEDASKDLSEDFYRLLRMFDEFEEERNQLYKLRENLKAREAWLQEHDKE